MPFTGKSTYSAGPGLPELAEDVSDIISLVSPYETPLLDHLGDAERAASSTVHEWLEDELLPNADVIADSSITSGTGDATLTVANGDRFRIGDQIQPAGSREVMFVTGVAGNDLALIRGYGGTTPEAIIDDQPLRILGHAALEGDDAPAVRFTNRVRRTNYTQIFTAGVEASGTMLAARGLGVADELEYQKGERLRELVRDLENCVINGVAPPSDRQGTASVRRTMRGILPSLATHRTDAGGAALTEDTLNTALRSVWESSSGAIDTIVVSGFQKRRINGFITASRQYTSRSDTYRDLVSVYESDFGVCRVVLSRWAPADTVLLLDSSRIDVLPMRGRSFHFKPLATTGDREEGMVVGEYTMELRNENAHAAIVNLAAA